MKTQDCILNNNNSALGLLPKWRPLDALILLSTAALLFLTPHLDGNAAPCSTTTSPYASDCDGTAIAWSSGALTINSGVTVSVTTTLSSSLAQRFSLMNTFQDFVNNGSIGVTTIDGSPLYLSRSINRVMNNGLILAGSNQGDAIGLYGEAQIYSLFNSGTIRSPGWGNAINISSTSSINLLTNQVGGFISSPSGNRTISSLGHISTLTNYGTIAGGGVAFYAGGTLTTLNNLQGAGNADGPLRIVYSLPQNYSTIISSPSVYGKLSGSNISNATGTSGINFGIYSSSTLTANTYTSVLTGFAASNILTSSLTGTFPGGFTYSLAQVGSTGVWDLTVSSTGGSSGASSSPGVTTLDNGRVQQLMPGSGPINYQIGSGGATLDLSSGAAQISGRISLDGPLTIQLPGFGFSSLDLSQLNISGKGTLLFTSGDNLGMSPFYFATLRDVNFNFEGNTIVGRGVALIISGDVRLGTGTVFLNPPNAALRSLGGVTLGGTGTLRNSVIAYDGSTIKPGNSPGYLGVTASVTMHQGSTLMMDIAGKTQSTLTSPIGATGYYSVLDIMGGQFVINSGAALTPRLSNLFSPTESGYGSAIYVPALGDRFRVVTASGGISGRFSTVTQPTELAAGTQFLPFYNMAGSNSLDLAVIPTSYRTTLASSSGNQNAQSVGTALDHMVVATQAVNSTSTQDELLYASSNQTAASLPGYTQSLAGEVYAAAVAVIAQTAQRVQQAVQARLGDTIGLGLPGSMHSAAGNTSAMGSTNALLSGGVPTAAMTSNPSLNPAADAASFSNGNVWGELAYQRGNRNSDSYSGGWTSNLYQLVFGSDFYAENGMKLGGGFALSSTTLTPVYGSATLQQGSLFAYGKMPVEEYVLDAMASVGFNASDISRSDASGLASGFRNKNVSGNDAMLSLGVSRPMDLQDIRLTPFARLTWQMVTQSGVNEGTTGAALTVDRYTGQGVRGVLGIAAGSKANNPLTEDFTYRAYVGIGADSSGLLNPTLNASLAGLSTNITTPKAGTTFVQAGLYGTAKFADNAYAYAGISGEARAGQTLGTVNLGVRVQF